MPSIPDISQGWRIFVGAKVWAGQVLWFWFVYLSYGTIYVVVVLSLNI